MKPLAITMGCPVAIGPELILKIFNQAKRPDTIVIGDPAVLRWCSEQLDIPASIIDWQLGAEVPDNVIPVYCPADNNIDTNLLSWGKPTQVTGKAMGRYIEEAVRLNLAGDISGIVTCPIAKSALNAGGYHFPGHTEMLANLCETTDYGMMMAGSKLRVTLVTIHNSLAEVPSLLTKESLTRMIKMTYEALLIDFGIEQPRLAVAALNPHAGEDGMFGTEEIEVFTPVIEQCLADGLVVTGPLPPDTVFQKAIAGQFDGVVCAYHDQGLIPFKLIHFADGVNVTMGLPIVRTSVDHGTAYDIAGKGIADPASLLAALSLAQEICKNRGKING